MARPPKGKPLTYRPIRLDDDVWKECQRLGKEHGTINEGLSAAQAALEMVHDLARRDPRFRKYVIDQLEDRVRKNIGKHFAPEPLENSPPVVASVRQKLGMKTAERNTNSRREPRQKGDKTR